MSILCKHLSMVYDSRGDPLESLYDINLSVADNEFVSIIGPSGCGKTTLLKIIAGLLRPTDGEVVFENPPVNGRLRTAMVFQDQGIFPWMTVLENATFGLEMQRVSADERRKHARVFLEKFGLQGFADYYPHELSGGMKQRVAIARAFLTDSPVLLMDEPFGALDAQTKLVLQEELLKLWRDSEKTVIYVTHDIEEAILMGDRVVVMTGRPGTILTEIKVPLPRPRALSLTDHPDMIEVKWQIWKMLEGEVRTRLQATS